MTMEMMIAIIALIGVRFAIAGLRYCIGPLPVPLVPAM